MSYKHQCPFPMIIESFYFLFFKQKDPFKNYIHQKEHNRMKKLQKIFMKFFKKTFENLVTLRRFKIHSSMIFLPITFKIIILTN
jgi:hypothetical protein